MTVKTPRIACVAALLLCLPLPTLPALANPSGPDIGGTWDSDATIQNPTFQTFNNDARLNVGVAVTLAPGSTLTRTSMANTVFTLSPDSRYTNNGTMTMAQQNSDPGSIGFIEGSRNSTDYPLFVNNGTLQVASAPNGTNIALVQADTPKPGGTVNFGTIHKTAGSGAVVFEQWRDFSRFDSTDGTFIVDEGTLRIGVSQMNISGTHTMNVAEGAALDIGGSCSGEFVGSGDGLLLWRTQVADGNSLTLNVDNGDRTDYTGGGVKLNSSSFTISTEGVVTNRGKFWFTPDVSGQWRAASAGSGLNLHNAGWLIWDVVRTGARGNLVRFAYGSELVNLPGGVLDVVGVIGDNDPLQSDYNGDLRTILQGGSTMIKRGTNATVSWARSEYFTIQDGATVHVQTGELEINPRSGTTFGSGPPTSDLRFNVTVDSNATLNIDDIPTAGITNIAAGATLHMKGSGRFMDASTDVLSNKLSTVNGTLQFSEGFTLDPGGDTLKVTPSGTFGGTGTLNGNLDCTGTFNVGTNGVIADKITVNGTVTLSGSLQVADALDSLPGTYVIIDNDSDDAVSGTFDGISQGTVIRVGTKNYKVSYRGGDGNDVAISFRARGTVLHIL